MAWTQTGNKPLAFEYRDADGVLWRAEQGTGGYCWRLTADGVPDESRTWVDLREVRLRVEGQIG